jgi:phospholipid/cholesterol/gamma-HCH transport system permease protein
MSMLDVSAMQYLVETQSALSLSTLFGGLFKAVVYGSLIGIAGCLQGLNCGNNAMAVGQATTNAVVMGIVMIVVSAAVLTVIYINIGI